MSGKQSSRIATWAQAMPTSELLPVAPYSKLPSRYTGTDWQPLQWADLEPTPGDLSRWATWDNCGIGLRGRLFPAFDLDCEDADVVRALRACITRYVPATAWRGRQDSYRLLIPFYCPGLRKARLAGDWGAVELLGDGQFYVVAGVHQSGAEYAWNLIPDATEMVQASLEQVQAAWDDIKRTLDILELELTTRSEPRQKDDIEPSTTVSAALQSFQQSVTPRDQPALGQLVQALEALTPGEYTSWVEGLMGIKHWSAEHAALGQQLAIWWSKRDSNTYQSEADVLAKWASIEAEPVNGTPITARTLIHRAKEVEGSSPHLDNLIPVATYPHPPQANPNGTYKNRRASMANVKHVFDHYRMRANCDAFNDKLYPTVDKQRVDANKFELMTLQVLSQNHVGTNETERRRALYLWAHDTAVNELTQWLDSCQPVEGKGIRDFFDLWLAPRIVRNVDLAYISFRRLLVSAVAAAYGPDAIGHHTNRFEQSVVFVGQQAEGKSNLIKCLVPKWVAERYVKLNCQLSYQTGTNFKDTQLKVTSSWIIEDAEYSQDKGTIEARKAFLSTEFDSFRPPFAANVIDKRRHCIIVCTTNQFDMLKDPTGSRRYEVIELDDAPLGMLGHDYPIEAIWHEAREAFFAHEPWWLEGEELKYRQMVNELYADHGPLWEQLIATFDWHNRPDAHRPDRNWMSSSDILTAMGVYKKLVTDESYHRSQRQLGQHLRYLKVYKSRRSYGYVYDMPAIRSTEDIARDAAQEPSESHSTSPLH